MFLHIKPGSTIVHSNRVEPSRHGAKDITAPVLASTPPEGVAPPLEMQANSPGDEGDLLSPLETETTSTRGKRDPPTRAHSAHGVRNQGSYLHLRRVTRPIEGGTMGPGATQR